YKVTVELPGYKTLNTKVTVPRGEGDHEHPAFTLERADGNPPVQTVRRALFFTDPAGAAVRLQDEQKNTHTGTSFEMPVEKPYWVTVELPGYKPKSTNFTLTRGEGEYRHPTIVLEKIKEVIDIPPKRQGDLFALLVGVRDYGGGLPRYAFADFDVTALAQ